jgi:hypothetical protein
MVGLTVMESVMVTDYQLLEQWLQEGILAAKAGQYNQARYYLLDVVEQDQTNETAWFWLYQIFDRHDDKRICLENLILINPYNEWAKQELLNYVNYPAQPALVPSVVPTDGAKPASRRKSQQKSKARRSPRSLVLKLITAFWAGISLIFLGSGIIASGEWLSSTIQSRNFPHYITGLQTLELIVAMGFLVAGLIGLNVAVALFFRSMVGFYGSLLLALGILLVGPTVSLIVHPPNYVALICTGGMSGMIVLLTLASQPGLKDSQQEHDPLPG